MSQQKRVNFSLFTKPSDPKETSVTAQEKKMMDAVEGMQM